MVLHGEGWMDRHPKAVLTRGVTIGRGVAARKAAPRRRSRGTRAGGVGQARRHLLLPRFPKFGPVRALLPVRARHDGRRPPSRTRACSESASTPLYGALRTEPFREPVGQLRCLTRWYTIPHGAAEGGGPADDDSRRGELALGSPSAWRGWIGRVTRAIPKLVRGASRAGGELLSPAVTH